MSDDALRQKRVVTKDRGEFKEAVLLADQCTSQICQQIQISHWNGYLISRFDSERRSYCVVQTAIQTHTFPPKSSDKIVPMGILAVHAH